MSLRSARERVLQTLCFEIGGLLLAAPLYALIAGAGTGESFVLIAALSVAVMLWSPVYNTVFDWLEWRWVGRVASDRPQLWRVVHAVSHEVTTMIVTLPVILVLTDLGWIEALLVDLGLTLFYAGYAYLFHLVYDRVRPVATPALREVA